MSFIGFVQLSERAFSSGRSSGKLDYKAARFLERISQQSVTDSYRRRFDGFAKTSEHSADFDLKRITQVLPFCRFTISLPHDRSWLISYSLFYRCHMNDKPSIRPALMIGIDWADQQHEIYVIDQQGKGSRESLEQTPEAIEAWIAERLVQSDGKPIGIILEQKRGALIHALMFRENVLLYPINPKQLARYRESFSNSGCKGDKPDARLLARMLYERHSVLKPWQPDDPRTRMLARLCHTRRQLVDERTRLIQQLISQLKACFPMALELNIGRSISALVLEILRRWPDPRQLKRADRRTLQRVLQDHGYRREDKREELISRIRSAQLLSRDAALLVPAAIVIQTLARQIPVLQKAIIELEEKIDTEMSQHPDASLFTALPGAGRALAPRLLTAFGSDRDRFESADQVSALMGIAPVTKQSGKSRNVHRRYACSKYLRQTFHEFADHARKWCPWSRAYYYMQRSRGMKHHAALRKLASRWIRILFQVWKSRTPYNPEAYLKNITRRNPDILPFLQNENQ
jgi:transposase